MIMNALINGDSYAYEGIMNAFINGDSYSHLRLHNNTTPSKKCQPLESA